MNINEIFTSDYLRAEDLKGKEVTVLISRVGTAELGNPPKPKLAVFFKDKNKPLIVNQTNARVISSVYGDETDLWLGKQIVLYPTWIEFNGQQKQSIGVKIIDYPSNVKGPQPDDELPF